MSELVLISRDLFLYNTVWVKDVSLFSNNLLSILYNSAQERGLIIVVMGQWSNKCEVASTSKSHLHNGFSDLENYAGIYVLEGDWH